MNRLLTPPPWLIHAVVWTLLIVNDVATSYYRPDHPVDKSAVGTYWFLAVGYTLISAAAFYGSLVGVARPLLRGPLNGKAVGRALGGLLLTLVSITALRYGLEMGVFKPLLGYDNYSRNPGLTLVWFVKNCVLYYFVYVLCGLVYAFIANRISSERHQRETEQARTAAELAFLRSQLNPHFLFNTINDIYVLVYRQSKKAPDALLKLSDLLRYMLHDARHERVPLTKEIDYLGSLIELQRLGLKDELCLDYRLTGPLNGQLIAPLLLVSFVENAFKHGLVSDPGHPIQLYLTITDATLDFTLHNAKHSQQKDQTGGIGLANVRRRLALLYANRHQLTVTDESDTYHVNLHLEL